MKEYDIQGIIRFLSPKLKEIKNLKQWCQENDVFYTYALNIKNKNGKKVALKTILKILDKFGIKYNVEKTIVIKIKNP